MDVGFGGFNGLVSALGGVYLPVDGRYFHVSSGTGANDWSSINLQPGYQLLGGTLALEWVRFRHLDSDFYRTARQQIFLREVGRQIRAQITDPTRISGILHALASATASDIHSFAYLLSLAYTLYGIPSSRITRVTMQANGLILNGIDYELASAAQKQTAVDVWSNPEAAINSQSVSQSPPSSAKSGSAASGPKKGGATKTLKKSSTPTVPSYTGLLVSDNGSGQTLLAPYRNLQRCAPAALPPGYTWGSSEPAREYTLAGYPAVAAWASVSSGVSVLWMWTTWQNPPILTDPSQTIVRGGHSYQLYYDSGHLRMVAWKVGATRVWVTNTLLNALSDDQMLALATSCQPL
jgi:hypothetical protein